MKFTESPSKDRKGLKMIAAECPFITETVTEVFCGTWCAWFHEADEDAPAHRHCAPVSILHEISDTLQRLEKKA